MTDEETDPVLLLLPWYLSGTLTAGETDLVRQRLEQSVEARRELDRLISLRHDLDAFFKAEPDVEPSPRIGAEVARRIGARTTAPVESHPAANPGWLDRISRSIQALFAPQWVPTAALTLIVAQFGWLATRNSVITVPPTQQVQTRALETPATRFRIHFRSEASQAMITDLLRRARARLANGPEDDGSWVIEIRSTDAQRVTETLQLATTRPDLVTSIEKAAP